MTLKSFAVKTVISTLSIVLPLAAQINFVQQNSRALNPSGSSIAVTYLTAQTAGNLNVVTVMWGDTTASVSSVTDSKGSIYSLAAGPTKATGLTSAIYYAKNIAGGSNTVTVKFNQTANYPNMNVLEYGGLDQSNPLDSSAAATGNGTTANSGSATTTSPNELIVAAGNPSSIFTGAGSGFSNRVINSFGGISQDRIVNTVGAYSASATLTSGTWTMQMATFRASGQASPQAPAAAPSVSSIAPGSGSANGGTALTITGTGFQPAATVTLGGAVATNVVVVSSTSITATTAAHSAGPVNVVVTNADNQNGTSIGGYAYTSSTGAINFVQQNYRTLNPSGSLVGVAYPAAQTAGDLNIVVVGWNDTNSVVKSVSDSRGNSYALAVGPTQGQALTQAIYYAKNIAAGSNTVTVTFNQTAAYPDVRVLEYTGADSTSPLDVTAAGVGNSSSGNSGPAATKALNELIFGAGMTFDGYKSAGAGMTSRVITNFGDIAEDAIVFTMGTYSATAALRSSVPWVMQMATFRASAAAAVGRTYTTNFPLTENPISEGGNWINGGSLGLDWTNIRTTPGFAFGLQSGTSPGLFDDSIAMLSGNWGTNQDLQGTVKIVTPVTAGGPCFQESELLLRWNLSPHSATGYEVNVGQRFDSLSYINVVRWNGPFGSFTTLLSRPGIAYGVHTGDVLRATMVGNVITVYINGVQKAQVTDNSFASGNPGMGMYVQSPSTCGSGASNFGFSSFTATDRVSP